MPKPADPVVHQQGFDASLNRCYDSNDQKGLFATSGETKQVLDDSYGLALELVKGGQETCERALEHEFFKAAARKPGKTKPYLIAIQLGAKPPNEAAHKACSDYAAVLENAYDQDIEVYGFADWFSDTSLSGCLVAVRAKRKAKKLKRVPVDEADTAPDNPPVAHEQGDQPPVQTIRYPLPQPLIIALNDELASVDQPSDDDMLVACERVVSRLLQSRQSLPVQREGADA